MCLQGAQGFKGSSSEDKLFQSLAKEIIETSKLNKLEYDFQSSEFILRYDSMDFAAKTKALKVLFKWGAE